jgi:hypothetical protein
MPSHITALVARLVSDEELILNKGKQNGVEIDMVFDILDERTLDIKDPETGEDLGSIVRPKVRVAVTQVSDRVCLARRIGGQGLTSLAAVLGGERRVRNILSTNAWPEGVIVGDEATWRGARMKRDPAPGATK